MAEVIAPVPLSHGRVLKIAVPVVISNATVPLLGLVDTGVVGQLGEAAAIGAVGLGAIIVTSIYWVFGFLRMGTTGLAAQALGASDAGEVAALLTRVLVFGGGAGLALILLHPALFAAILWIAPGSAEVEALALGYLQIRIFSAPAAIALFGLSGWLIAQERTWAVLVLQLWQNGLNIVLSIWFVLGLDMGVAGVAWATLISELTGLALGLILCRAAFYSPAWRDWPRIRDRARLTRMVAVNADILVRSLLLMGAFTSFMFVAAGVGDVTLAANQVLIQFLYVTSYALDGFAFASEALVGRAVGARAPTALARAVRLCLIWGVGLGVAFSLAFATGGGAIIDLLTTAEGVRATARDYLPWLVAVPLVAALAFILDGVFIGATWTRDMRNMMIVSFAGYVACAFVLTPLFGNHGLWASLIVFFALRGGTLAWRYPDLLRRVGTGV